MLQSRGLFPDGSRLQSGSWIYEEKCVSGLVIDDFFSISAEKVGIVDVESAQSVQRFYKAKEAYTEELIVG